MQAEAERKFGRPGKSGRKRTLPPTPDNELHKRQRLQYVDNEEDDVGHQAEDEVTIQKHVTWLKKEARKQEVDKDGVNHRMRKTKIHRREFLKGASTIVDGLAEYPILRHRAWLVGEPHLQFGITVLRVMDDILPVLEKLEEKVRYKCKSFETKGQRKDEELENTIDEGVKTDILLHYAYQLLPSVFGEQEKYIVVASEKDIQSPAPVIVGTLQKGFNVLIEGEKVLCLTCKRFRAALEEAWFASFWAFSLEYPTALKKTMALIEYAVVKCSSSPPASVKSWAERLGF